MPRTLPWLNEPAPRTTTARKPRRIATPPLDADARDEAIFDSPPPPVIRTRARSSSPCTFPAPAPSPDPGPETETEPMRPGYSADDAYKLVEDEFLSTAQSFTRHLRKQEYHRLQVLARDRLARGQVEERPRPVNGDLAPESSRIEATKRAQVAKINGALERLKPIVGEDDDDGDPWLEDPHLADLMVSPRKPARVLRALGLAKSTSKAAVLGHEASPSRHRGLKVESGLDNSIAVRRHDGSPSPRREPFKHQQDALETASDADSDESDDLDAAIRVKKPRVKSTATKAHVMSPTHHTKIALPASRNTVAASLPTPAPQITASTAGQAKIEPTTSPANDAAATIPMTFDDGPEPQSAAMQALVAKRKARKAAMNR